MLKKDSKQFLKKTFQDLVTNYKGSYKNSDTELLKPWKRKWGINREVKLTLVKSIWRKTSENIYLVRKLIFGVLYLTNSFYLWSTGVLTCRDGLRQSRSISWWFGSRTISKICFLSCEGWAGDKICTSSLPSCIRKVSLQDHKILAHCCLEPLALLELLN